MTGKKISKNHLYTGFIIAVFLISIVVPFTSWPSSSQISDKDFFKMLDRSNIELESIIAAADSNDIEQAADLWLDYIRNRDYVHFEPIVAENNTQADANLNHSFSYLHTRYTLEGENKTMFNRTWSDITWHEKLDGMSNHWLNQLSRFSHLANFAKKYLFSGEEVYAWEFYSEIIDWIQDEEPGSSPYTWRTLDTGIRINRWIRPLMACMNSSYLTGRVMLEISKSLIEQVRFLTTSHRKTNNWMLIESLGMLMARSFLPEITESTKWENEAWESIELFFEQGVFDDGGVVESSTGYHFTSLEALNDILTAADQYSSINAPITFFDTLAKMTYYGLQVHAPDRKIYALGDGSPRDKIRQVLYSAQYCELSDLYPQLIYFNESWEPSGQGTLPQTHISFPDGGYYITRTSWDSDALFSMMDAASVGLYHYHRDSLSFGAYAYDKRFLIDPGIHDYDQSDTAEYQKSSWGHSMFIIDEITLEKGWDTVDVTWAAGTYGTTVRGTHDMWGADASRELVFSPRGYWIVNDFWEGKNDHSVDLLYQLPDSNLTSISPNILNTSFTGEANMLFGLYSPWDSVRSIRGGEGTGDEAEFGKISYGTNTWIPGRTMRIQADLDGPSCWSTALYPTPGNNTFTPTFTPLRIKSNGVYSIFNESFSTPGIAMAIETPDGLDVHISLRESQTIEIDSPNFSNIVFTGKQCIIQFRNNSQSVEAVYSSDIEFLSVNGEMILTKSNSQILSSINKFTIHSDSVVPISVNGTIITNYLYQENGLTVGGFAL